MSRSIARVWLGVIRDIKQLDSNASAKECDVIQGFGDEDTNLHFACRSRAFYRAIDATDHILVAGAVFLKGFEVGLEVALPPRPYAILCSLHTTVGKKTSDTRSTLATVSEQRQADAEQSLTEDSHVIVSSSHAILDGLTKAGEGKSEIYRAVLSGMSDNNPHKDKKDGFQIEHWQGISGDHRNTW